MVQCRGGAGFASKSFQRLRVSTKFIGQEFKRHKAPELGIFRLIDDTHTTTPELLDDAIVRDGLAQQRGGTPILAENLRVHAEASQTAQGDRCWTGKSGRV